MSISMPCHPKHLLLAIAIALSVADMACATQPERSPRIAIADAMLDSNGTWQGVVVTPDGLTLSHASLELASGSRRRAPSLAVTDDHGRFRFEKVHPGTHLLRSGNDIRIYRLWKFGTAPPSADRGTLVVLGDTVSRGKLYDWASSHPFLTYGGLAAAIAVPIAVIGSAQSSTPASP